MRHRKTQRSSFISKTQRIGEAALRNRLQVEASTSFDPENGLLLRALLFRRSSRECVLLLSAHHIIVDFWSLGVLLRELALLYEAEVEGRPATLPATRSYSDYVRRETTMLAGPEGERLRTYWLQQLAGELPVLDCQLIARVPQLRLIAARQCQQRWTSI